MKIRLLPIKSGTLASLLCNALAFLPSYALHADVVSPQTPRFSFVPNQLEGNAWYKPGDPPQLIKGHLDSSFGRKELWPQLRKKLKLTHGTFSLFAAEIG